MKEQLKNTELYFRSLLNNIHEDIMVIDREYLVTDVNNNLMITTGMSRDELIGKHCYEVTHHLNLPCNEVGEECLLQKVFTSGKSYTCRHKHHHSDGPSKTVDILLSPHTDENGDVTHVIEAMRDVSALAEAMRKIKDSENELAAVFEGSPIAMILVDRDRRVCRASRAALRFTARTDDEILGMRGGEALRCLNSFDDSRGCGFGPRCESCVIRRAVVSTFENGESHFGVEATLTLMVENKRTETTFMVAATPIEVKGERMALVCMEDITPRKEIETALKASQRDLSLAQHIAHVGSWRLDIQLDRLAWSDECYRIFGIPTGTPMTYEAFLDRVHPDDRAYVDKCWQRALRGKPYDIEHRVVVNEEIKWIRETAQLEFDDDGNLKGGFGIAQDITENKKIAQIKDEFLSMVSHELKTPLTVILGSLETAKVDSISKEQRSELLKNALEGVVSLDSILDNMLELSRYQANRLHLDTQSVDVFKLVTKVFEALKRKGIPQDLISDFTIPAPKVSADPVRVERILYNLIENATKYSPTDSYIVVTSKTDGEHLVVGVVDQGVGIAPEKRDRLFKSFDRLGTKAASGLGLGLVVCKRLVEAQNGRIWLKSNRDKGSTFYFSLPLAKKN